MKKKTIRFLSLLLCISFLLVGCVPSATEPEATEPEEVTEHETVTEPEEITETEAMTESEEITETEKTTEPEIITEPESEKITEMEETTETNPIAESEEPSESETVTEPERNESEETESGSNVDSDAPSPYELLCYFDGMVVRWGSVVEDESPVSDFEGVSGEVSDFLLAFDMIKVGIEVLDVVEHEYSCTDEIFALKTLLIPRDAMKSVAEGDESLVFFYYQTVGYTEDDVPVWIGFVDPYPFAWNYPIFEFENGCMILSDSQMQEYNSGVFRTKFLCYAWQANQAFIKCEIDIKYHFRSGMTVEELEQFYVAAKALPWDYYMK